jgi:DNA-damage-inducible protein D
MTQIQLLAAIAAQMAEQEQRLLAHEQRQEEILSRLKGVEVEQDRFNTPCGHKYTIVGFAILQGLELSAKEAGAKGRKASTLCRQNNIEIDRIYDPRFGRVGLYPESILIEVFSQEQN